MTFSNNLPVVERRLIGHKLGGNFGSLPGFGNVMTFATLQGFDKLDNRRQCQVYQCSPWKVPEAFIWNAINSDGLPQFQGIN
jgi:hypothetical protein